MSMIQTALHALPAGTIVTKALEKSNREVNAHLDQRRTDEVTKAKAIQQQTGCSWGAALRAAIAP